VGNHKKHKDSTNHSAFYRVYDSQQKKSGVDGERFLSFLFAIVIGSRAACGPYILLPNVRVLVRALFTPFSILALDSPRSDVDVGDCRWLPSTEVEVS
jgi:hypothetical protein